MSNMAHGSTAGAAEVVVTPSVVAGVGIGSTLPSGAMLSDVLSGVVVRATVVRGGRDVVGGAVVGGGGGGTATGARRSAEHAAMMANPTSTAAARRRLKTTHQ
jgi:hypothetical protein